MKRFRIDQVSASLTCLCKKCPMEMRGRSQEKGLGFETLGRNVMLTWSQLILKTPVSIVVAAAVGFSVRATGVETTRQEPNFSTLQRLTSFGAKRGIKLGNRRNVYG